MHDAARNGWQVTAESLIARGMCYNRYLTITSHHIMYVYVYVCACLYMYICMVGADANRAYGAGNHYTVMSDPKLSSSMKTTLTSIATLSITRMVCEKLRGSVGPSLMRKELAHHCSAPTCRASFNTMVWKQHCRCCGHIFCKKCLPTRRSIQVYHTIPYHATIVSLC